MPYAQRGHHRIHYTTYGDPSAPPVLLIMGLGVSSLAWDDLPQRLSDRYFVITFDNWGTGHSGHRWLWLRMGHMAEDALAVLDAVGVPPVKGLEGGAFVFGISMGGMIAQELVLRHPDRVRALALGATFASYLFSRKPPLRSVFDLMRIIGKGRQTQAEVITRLLTTPAFVAQNPHTVNDWFLRSDSARKMTAVTQLGAIVGHHTRGRLRQIQCPTLIMSGDADRLVPIENSRALARLIPHSQLVVLEGAGHVFPLEKPEATVKALVTHFAV